MDLCGQKCGQINVSPKSYVLAMHQQSCPPQLHFHVVFEQVGNISRPNRTVVAQSAEEALSNFVTRLPVGWRGGVSIFDDEIGHEDEMPILHTYVGAF